MAQEMLRTFRKEHQMKHRKENLSDTLEVLACNACRELRESGYTLREIVDILECYDTPELGKPPCFKTVGNWMKNRETKRRSKTMRRIIEAARLLKNHKTRARPIFVGAMDVSFEALPVLLMPDVSGKRENIQSSTLETREDLISALDGKQIQFAAIPGPLTIGERQRFPSLCHYVLLCKTPVCALFYGAQKKLRNREELVLYLQEAIAHQDGFAIGDDGTGSARMALGELGLEAAMPNLVVDLRKGLAEHLWIATAEAITHGAVSGVIGSPILIKKTEEVLHLCGPHIRNKIQILPQGILGDCKTVLYTRRDILNDLGILLRFGDLLQGAMDVIKEKKEIRSFHALTENALGIEKFNMWLKWKHPEKHPSFLTGGEAFYREYGDTFNFDLDDVNPDAMRYALFRRRNHAGK